MDEQRWLLCKEVFEKTGWKAYETLTINTDSGFDGTYQVYTSDYLLERLPFATTQASMFRLSKPTPDEWLAYYHNDDRFETRGETPLLALLRLTLALHEKNLLKEKE